MRYNEKIIYIKKCNWQNCLHVNIFFQNIFLAFIKDKTFLKISVVYTCQEMNKTKRLNTVKNTKLVPEILL